MDSSSRRQRDALRRIASVLEGARCRVVSLASLARTKARTRSDPDEATKGRADSEVLVRIGRG